MLQHALYPLRTVLGQSVQITNRAVTLIHQSKASRDLKVSYSLIHRSGVAETRHGDVYQKYYPTFRINSVIYRVHSGDVPLPAPSDLPFDSGAPLVSLFAHSQPAGDAGISRRLSVQLKLELAEERQVGGICFAGLPYLPSSISEVGESAANFGLPREWRLTCASDDSEFLDGETSTSLQMVLGHSGFHYLLIEPTMTKELFLHLSDFPLFLTSVQTQADAQPTIERCYGFAVPYFYVFEYREGSRYRSSVPGGLLAAQTRTKPERPPIGPLVPGREHQKPLDILAQFLGDAEYLHVVDAERAQREIIPFTAASIFSGARSFSILDGRTLGEAFVSTELSKDESLTLYFAQGEEYRRCIAGLRPQLWFVPEQLEGLSDLGEAFADFADPQQFEAFLEDFARLPEEITFCRRIGVRVAEIDPLEGVSPIQVDIDSKHATVLYEGDLNTVEELGNLLLRGLRFDRPTLSRYLAIEFTNRGNEAGQIVLGSMTLGQSANVSVGTRPSRTQQVQTLHFRLMGEQLAADYAALGGEGFTLSVEHWVAGNRKSVLFSARSLLDLLDSPQVRLHRNHRFLETTSDVTSSHARSEGWRQTETGHGVGWYAPGTHEEIDARPPSPVTGNPLPPPDPSPNARERVWWSFTSRGNSEIRNHMTHVGYSGNQSEQTGDQIKTINDMIKILADSQFISFPISDSFSLSNGWESIWHGASIDTIKNISGIFNLNVPPHSILTEIQNDIISKMLDPQMDINTSDEFLQLIVRLMLQSVLSGVSASISLSTPIGASLSSGQLLPTANRSVANGESGSINRQATNTNYQFSRNLQNSFDEAKIFRKVLHRDQERRRGAEVMWQGELVDIVTGTIPLNLALPATASKAYRTGDESIRVRLNGGVGRSIKVDVWFDVLEEVVRDDY